MLGCAFEQVGQEGEGVLLNSISGKFADYDELQVASIKSGKLKYTSYYFYTADGGIVDTDGWYNGDFEPIGDSIQIPVGSAFWFISENNKAKDATISGQVHNGSFTHTITDKKMMICSAFPVAFNPNVNCNWVGFEDYDEIQVSSINKNTGKLKYESSYYYTQDGGIVDEDGWYDGDFALIEEPITVAGQGFWLVLGGTSGRSFVEQSPVK